MSSKENCAPLRIENLTEKMLIPCDAEFKNTCFLELVQIWLRWINIIAFSLVMTACSSGDRRADSSDSASYSSRAETAMEQPQSQVPVDIATPVGSMALETRKAKRDVIYIAQLSIKVKNIENSIQRIQNMVANHQGYIQDSGHNRGNHDARLTLRIPVASFTSFLNQMENIGHIFHRSINAEDVSDQLFDLKQRIVSATQARTRMYDLLKKSKDVKQRVKILKEIERLNQQIEKLNNQLRSMSHKAAMSTIHVYLDGKQSHGSHFFTASPFPWIVKLQPQSRTLHSIESFAMKAPQGFVDNTEEFKNGDSPYLYLAPDQTQLRLAFVDNRPKADPEFWAQALVHELNRRNYMSILQKPRPLKKDGDRKQKEKRFISQYIVYQISDGYSESYYGIIIADNSDTILVIEMYYPNLATLKKNEQSLLKSINGITF